MNISPRKGRSLGGSPQEVFPGPLTLTVDRTLPVGL